MFWYTYDGTFEGLLTTIFDIYERRAWPDKISKAGVAQSGLFSQSILVITDEGKADRVWKGLANHVSPAGRTKLYKVYLSELPESEMLIYHYVRLAFASSVNIEDNFAEDCVRRVAEIDKQIFREKHRMEAFVRFQKTADDLYYATIEPDFNILPLLQEHFEKRYADQRWLIYDTRRHLGLYYDLHEVKTVVLENKISDKAGSLSASILDQSEPLYQQLWQTYFHYVNIPERKNTKLHLRHMPQRYWKYLTEKQPHPGRRPAGK